jgi:hypothetical protein
MAGSGSVSAGGGCNFVIANSLNLTGGSSMSSNCSGVVAVSAAGATLVQ